MQFWSLKRPEPVRGRCRRETMKACKPSSSPSLNTVRIRPISGRRCKDPEALKNYHSEPCITRRFSQYLEDSLLALSLDPSCSHSLSRHKAAAEKPSAPGRSCDESLPTSMDIDSQHGWQEPNPEHGAGKKKRTSSALQPGILPLSKKSLFRRRHTYHGEEEEAVDSIFIPLTPALRNGAFHHPR